MNRHDSGDPHGYVKRMWEIAFGDGALAQTSGTMLLSDEQVRANGGIPDDYDEVVPGVRVLHWGGADWTACDRLLREAKAQCCR
jgi:hypothetical protein